MPSMTLPAAKAASTATLRQRHPGSCPYGRRKALPLIACVLVVVYSVGHGWQAALETFVGGTFRPRWTDFQRSRAGTEHAACHAFTFGVAKHEEHVGLDVKEGPEGTFRLETSSNRTGHWNTVLGDTQIPTSGRSYFEVKIVAKPLDSWESIGVAEVVKGHDRELVKNREKNGFFMRANWREVWTYMAWKDDKPLDDMVARWVQAEHKWLDTRKFQHIRGQREIPILKEAVKVYADSIKMTGKMLITGQPVDVGGMGIKKGDIIGVEVDMDADTVSYWKDGKRISHIRRTIEGGPLDLKKKKLFPAVSVFGIRRSGYAQNTIMEFRSGRDAPPAR